MSDWFPASSDGRAGFEWEPPAVAPIHCPTCGAELGYLDQVYRTDSDRLIFGCTHCVTAKDADEWAMEEREAG